MPRRSSVSVILPCLLRYLQNVGLIQLLLRTERAVLDLAKRKLG
jgi:hypothetical protein